MPIKKYLGPLAEAGLLGKEQLSNPAILP